MGAYGLKTSMHHWIFQINLRIATISISGEAKHCEEIMLEIRIKKQVRLSSSFSNCLLGI